MGNDLSNAPAEGAPRRIAKNSARRAVSSVGERFLDTEEVTCSIHVPPKFEKARQIRQLLTVNPEAPEFG
jgi:hypothetical protein